MSRFNKKTKRQIHKSIENPSGVVHLRHQHGDETLCGYPYEYATIRWKLTQKPASCKKCLKSAKLAKIVALDKQKEVPKEMPEEKEYINYYCCERCKHRWADVWSCMCDDRCPECNISMTPYKSEDVVHFNHNPSTESIVPKYIHIKSPTGKVHAVNTTELRFEAYGPGRHITVCNSSNYESGEGMWRKWPKTNDPVTCKRCLKLMGVFSREYHKEVIAHQVVDESRHPAMTHGYGEPSTSIHHDMCIFEDSADAKALVDDIAEEGFRTRKVKITYLEE